MTTIVFVGPTLPAAEVHAALPGARVAPPVAVGQVLWLARRRGVQRIAIIDGYFERMAAVWHKEILIAIERGIAVYGAASMGALRAAELAPFGMIGVGAVFADYRRGVLESDDEVAVAHLPAEQGFAAISEALVDLRHAIERAPMLSARSKAALIERARGLFYRDRTWARVVAEGAHAGVPARQLAAFSAWPKPSRKAADARLLLRRLARDPIRRPKPIRVPRTWALGQLEPVPVPELSSLQLR